LETISPPPSFSFSSEINLGEECPEGSGEEKKSTKKDKRNREVKKRLALTTPPEASL
jgi:hypothetical protein